MLVHGDDFAAIGPRAGLQKFKDLMQKAYECKVEAIGPNEGDQKGLRVLGRMINYTEHGLRYEPDPRHAEAVIKDLGLADAKSVLTPRDRELDSKRTTASRPEKPG